MLFVVGVLSQNVSYAQAPQTSGGVNVDGSWYLGEGLKKGDYFEYKMCELDLNDCAPITMKLWIKGDKTMGTETLWDTDVVIIDGSKIIKGNIALGKVSPEPIVQKNNDLFHYARAFKSSVAWLSAFATGDEGDFIHGPKEFRDNAWGKIGAIGGSQLIPKRAETVNTFAGSFDSIVVGWYSGNNNEIWVVDDFPFPVKARAYAWVTTGIAPVMFEFELLDYEENVNNDPFTAVIPTIDEKKVLGCQTEYFDYETKKESTNTSSMMIIYSYAPKNPKEGCDIDWKINFKNKYNQEEFVNQVHFDIWVVDDKGNKLRSLADELGRDSFFNGFGLAHITMPVKELSGKNNYAIFVYGVGPQYQVSTGELAGYVIAEIDIAKNENISSLNNNNVLDVNDKTIPDWIKNNAGWWADGQIGDSDFVQGIQFLIKEGIITVTSTDTPTEKSDVVPDWIKNNAGWWADGQIDDESFIQGMEFLVKIGILSV